MDKLLPNMALLKAPSNWFLVGFTVILLVFIVNILFKDTSENG